jgi:hypothetical protein
MSINGFLASYTLMYNFLDILSCMDTCRVVLGSDSIGNCKGHIRLYKIAHISRYTANLQGSLLQRHIPNLLFFAQNVP